jgi:hypothetical protein
MQTLQKTPTLIIPNATPSLDWQDYNNVLLADGTFAVSTGNTQILTVGNFNLNFSQGDVITNFIVGLKGYRGSFATTLDIYAEDGLTINDEVLISKKGNI